MPERIYEALDRYYAKPRCICKIWDCPTPFANSLVLGAWGCGAFDNDPVATARQFKDALSGDFAGAFAEVVFAIVDWSPGRRLLGVFRDAFHEELDQEEEDYFNDED